MILFVVVFLRSWVERDVERNMLSIAKVLADRIELVEDLDRPDEMAALNASLSSVPSIQRVLYVDEDGNVGHWQYARAGLDGLAELPESAGPSRLLRSFGVDEILDEEGHPGRLIFLVSTEEAESRLHRALWKMGGLVALGSLLAGVIAWAIGRRFASSVERIEAAVVRVAEDRDYQVKLPNIDVSELRNLAAGVQHLMSVVDEGNRELASEIRRSSEVAALAEFERNRLSTLIEAMPTGIALLSAEGKLVFFNTALCQLFGVEEKDLRGQSGGAVQEMLSGGSATVAAGLGKLFGLSADAQGGEWVDLLLRDESCLMCSCILMPRAESTERLVLFRDVTVERRAERLEEGLRQAQQMESLGRMASAVSHDFNNILTAIIGFGQLALSGTAEDDPNGENIREILAAADSAKQVTDKLLLLSQRRPRTPKAVAVLPILEAQRGMLGQLLPTIEVSLEGQDQIGFIQIDPSEFERAVVNIAVNAGDAMPEGGSLRISMEQVDLSEDSGRAEEYIAIAFADTGVGIPEEDLRRVTEPFFTTKDVGAGTGLGLATVTSIVERAGGHLKIESAIGVGTTVTIYVPVSDMPRAVQRGLNVKIKQGGNRTQTGHVLLVEDSDMVRRTTALLLGAMGLEVSQAANGPEAINFVESEPAGIDLLLTDVVMPGMRGRELATKIQALRPGIAVLIMSGYDDEMIEPGSEKAHYPLLRKPFTREELANAVGSLLEART